MSDYLKHLAARSLNRTPSMQPRVASRFEPSTLAAAPPASEPVLDSTQLDAEENARPLSPSGAHAPQPTENRQRTADTAPRSLDATPLSEARHESRTHNDAVQPPETSSSRLPYQTSPSNVFTPSSVREQARSPAQATPETERTPPPQASEEAHLRLRHAGDPQAHRPPETNESALERSIRRIVAGEFEAREAEVAAGGSSRSHARTGKGMPPPVMPVSTVASRRSPVTTREQADASAQASPPIIRVTIGRIEVRAVTPQGQRVEARSAPPAGARPDPARSLREYLKQRSGGRP
ncbi:MAG TPA: hypothetical protein VGB76_06560 [Pyrinomonadaceae bacterium]|jgi:hypothetical protein